MLIKRSTKLNLFFPLASETDSVKPLFRTGYVQYFFERPPINGKGNRREEETERRRRGSDPADETRVREQAVWWWRRRCRRQGMVEERG